MFIKVHRKLKNMHLSSHTSLIFAYRKGLHTDIFLKHGQDLSLKQVYPELLIVLKTFVQKGAALGFQSILQWQGFKGFGASLSKQIYRGFSQTAVRKKTERRRKRMKQMARESSLTAFSVLEREKHLVLIMRKKVTQLVALVIIMFLDHAGSVCAQIQTTEEFEWVELYRPNALRIIIFSCGFHVMAWNRRCIFF